MSAKHCSPAQSVLTVRPPVVGAGELHAGLVATALGHCCCMVPAHLGPALTGCSMSGGHGEADAKGRADAVMRHALCVAAAQPLHTSSSSTVDPLSACTKHPQLIRLCPNELLACMSTGDVLCSVQLLPLITRVRCGRLAAAHPGLEPAGSAHQQSSRTQSPLVPAPDSRGTPSAQRSTARHGTVQVTASKFSST